MLNQLLDPKILTKLTDIEKEKLADVLGQEILKNPTIQKILQEKVDTFKGGKL